MRALVVVDRAPAVEGEGAPSGEETVNFTGSVRLIDGAGAELYATTGTVQCGS